jgi:hypothetical protein
MKIYGNSKSDGFPVLVCVVGALFVVGGVGLNFLGAVTMFAALPLAAALIAVMVMKLSKWDVMSEVEAPRAEAASRVSFPVAAASDSSAAPAPAAWSPSMASKNDSVLPLPVEKPKSAVETNTAVV